MKVSEFIALLQKMPQDLDVYTGDYDYWFYEPKAPRVGFIHEGQEVEEDDNTSEKSQCVLCSAKQGY